MLVRLPCVFDESLFLAYMVYDFLGRTNGSQGRVHRD